MSIHAVVNEAGSAGKTTTAVTLAALLAESRRRVLLWDNDAQGNATLSVGVQAAEGKTAAEVLLGECSVGEVVTATVMDNLFVVPANRALQGAAVQLTRGQGGELRLRAALESVAGEYDCIIIDCPGAASILTVAAMVAATSVIAVTQPTLKELEGLPNLEDTISSIRDAHNPALRLTAVVPCAVPPLSAGTLYVEALDYLRSNYSDEVTPPVRRSVRVPEAYSQRRPLPLHAPMELVTNDYQEVLDVLVHRRVMP